METYTGRREVIRDKDGKIIQTSRNLAGIRRYVGKHLIKRVAIDAIGQGDGKLSILFDDGASFETNFASFGVLKNFLRQWRNVYGAPLLVNGEEFGTIDYHNSALSS